MVWLAEHSRRMEYKVLRIALFWDTFRKQLWVSNRAKKEERESGTVKLGDAKRI